MNGYPDGQKCLIIHHHQDPRLVNTVVTCRGEAFIWWAGGVVDGREMNPRHPEINGLKVQRVYEHEVPRVHIAIPVDWMVPIEKPDGDDEEESLYHDPGFHIYTTADGGIGVHVPEKVEEPS